MSNQSWAPIAEFDYHPKQQFLFGRVDSGGNIMIAINDRWENRKSYDIFAILPRIKPLGWWSVTGDIYTTNIKDLDLQVLAGSGLDAMKLAVQSKAPHVIPTTPTLKKLTAKLIPLGDPCILKKRESGE